MWLALIKKNILIKNTLTSQVIFSTQKLPVVLIFDLEKKSSLIEYEDFISSYSKTLDIINSPVLIDNLFQKISKEITISSYSQEKYTPTESDYESLRSDLGCQEIHFYPEDAVMLLGSNKIFPDMTIYCQIDRAMNVLDLSLELKSDN